MRSDDEAEFAGLVERQWRFACRVAWSVLRQRQDAEDAAQEAFLKIWRAQAVRDLRDERAYIARAAWREAITRLRTRRPAGESEGEMEMLEETSPGPEQQVVTADWEIALHRLIDSLPEDLRQPLALSAEMNSREIAAVMGIAEGTVRTRLMRARAILRDKMTAMEERRYAGR